MRKIVFFLSLCLIVIVFVGAMFVHDVFLISPKSNEQAIEIVIPQGSSVTAIATQLIESHLVVHPTFFKWFVWFAHADNKLQAGTFSFVPNTSIASIVLTLINSSLNEIQVTIPEGFTNNQIKLKFIEVFPKFDQSDWDIQTKNLEGYLFPDTYRFAKDETVKNIVGKMQLTLERRLIENQINFNDCPKYDSSMGYVSPFRCSMKDTIILASIIEKEVKSPEDMKRVVGVLLNRLSIGMALQVDSTLTYVTQKTSAQLTANDLKNTSPYNTYAHKGLPPTPISNPGMNAILAVFHPTKSNDLYFLTKPDGTAVFARTHDEHVRNKEKYLR